MRKPILLMAGLASALPILLSAPAAAGGFGVREQSAHFQGMSFAGSAAGGDLSSMYWNSAAAAFGTGCNSSANVAIAAPRLRETAESGRLVTGSPAMPPAIPAVRGNTATSTDVGGIAGIPASYVNCQLSQQLYFGLGLNAPFAAASKPDDPFWAGATAASTTKIVSANINPVLAYKVAPGLTVGAGVQIQHMSIHLTRRGLFSTVSAATPLTPSADYTADGWATAFTAGGLWQPLRSTTIGLGYRSAITQDVEGTYTRGASLAAGPGRSSSGKASVKLPDIVTLSVRHQATPTLAILGTFEWSNWSRIGESTVSSTGCAGGICDRLQLDYSNGYLLALGAEFAASPKLTLRAGLAFERAPVTDSVRDIAVPDSNRIMTSAGLSYKVTDSAVIDLAYSHLFMDDAPICIAQREANGGSSHCTGSTRPAAILFKGKSENAADLVSVGMKVKF